MRKNKEMIALLVTGFLQVYFVAVGTVFLSKGIYLGVIVTGFLISFIWSFNVKKIAFGTMKDRVVYATGAMLGSVTGLAMSEFLIRLLTKY